MAETFRIERSTVIGASAASIHPLIDDFHRWVEWSPYERMDPNMAKTFAGAAAGVGSIYSWVGTKAGSGRMEITTSGPDKIVIKLDFSKPFEAHNTAEFTLEPQGKSTKVTWAMTGPVTLMSRIMKLIFSMEKMVGPQFEEGLASMKQVAEAG